MIHLVHQDSDFVTHPLARITIVVAEAEGAFVTVTDGENRRYFIRPSAPRITFQIGGALGIHTIRILAADQTVLSEMTFKVDAATSIDDKSGPYADLFQILLRSMRCYDTDGTSSLRWKGKTYRYFVPWILDHAHTARGMQYFSPAAGELVELLALAQREDGMIWSQAMNEPKPGYFDTRDGNRNFYTRRDDEIRFMRQPVENHCEYNFVDCFYLTWKSSGDDEWMKSLLPHACRALDYTRNSPVRWSEKFGLLKRGYTIDSWDFQIEDEYAVEFPISSAMCIDEEKTKFGIFFGDNTGYAQACNQLGKMLAHAGENKAAKKYEERSRKIRERLTALSWNGRFYQHRVEEDHLVTRNLGVNEKDQIAMSNAYSLNRDIPDEHCHAIIATYQELLKNAPAGSPGEWYAIYPPFERGFNHGAKWQYMNGGVHGHAAGELARGAFAHGHELYGVDILTRLHRLAQASGNRVKFAYTGAQDPQPPTPIFTPIDLHAVANMDLRHEGAPGVHGWMDDARPGNDLKNLPTGLQTLAGVPYQITDPVKNGGRAVIAVSKRANLPESVTVQVEQKAAAIYLLHTASATGSTGIGGSCTFVYDDSTEHTEYLIQGRHFCGWWFPELEQDRAGVAWEGANEVSTRVGLSWACVKNPHPDKTICGIVFQASLDGALYAVAGVTLSNSLPHGPYKLVSTGGPDNWAGGTCMAALIEGLAGVEDDATAFKKVLLSPRWAAASTDAVQVTVRYPSSQGYVCYDFAHDSQEKAFNLTITGSGESGTLRLLLPPALKTVCKVLLDGEPVSIVVQQVAKSHYLQVPLDSLTEPRNLQIFY